MGDEAALLYEVQQMQRQQRVQFIQDMFGAKADDFETFVKNKRISNNWGKLIGLGAIGGAIGGGIGFFAQKAAVAGGTMIAGSSLSTATIVGAGVIGLLFSVSLGIISDGDKAGKAYDQYLTNFAAKAREAYEKQKAPTIPDVNQRESSFYEKQWTDDIENSRTITDTSIGRP